MSDTKYMRQTKRFLSLLSVCVLAFLASATVAGAHCMPTSPDCVLNGHPAQVCPTTPTTVPVTPTTVVTPTTIPAPTSTLTPVTPTTVATPPTTAPAAPVAPSQPVSQPNNCNGPYGGFAGCSGAGLPQNNVPDANISVAQTPTPPVATSAAPTLAYTGVNVVPLLIIGFGCVVGGLLLIKRRKMRA